MQSNAFHYVYILLSQNGNHRYIGSTSDLASRLKRHNEGRSPHTSKRRPWHIETSIAFRDSIKAQAFEKYLKSGSGREFPRRHF